MAWEKTWLLTVSARGPRIDRLYAQDRERVLTWFSDGLLALFSDFREHLRPAPIKTKAVHAQQGDRRTIVSGYGDLERIDDIEIEYQVERGPQNDRMHAHAFIRVRLLGNNNVHIRYFHGNGDGPWWQQYWERPDNPVNQSDQEDEAFRARLVGGAERTFRPSLFGFHLQPVRPRGVYEDVLDYLRKSTRNPTYHNPRRLAYNKPRVILPPNERPLDFGPRVNIEL